MSFEANLSQPPAPMEAVYKEYLDRRGGGNGGAVNGFSIDNLLSTATASPRYLSYKTSTKSMEQSTKCPCLGNQQGNN